MPIQIWGEKGSLDFAQMDVMAIPCHMKVTLDQGKFDIENLNECVWDRDESLSYLNMRNDLILYHNQASFVEKNYDSDIITENSILTKLRADMTEPHWFKSYLQRNILYDESDWLQLGQESVYEFN